MSSPLTSSYFYPDVVVVCEEPGFEDDVFDTLLNPILLVEVLSPSTEAFDRGENSHTTGTSHRCRNTSLSLKTRCLLNISAAKKSSGFSPISKNARRFYRSSPSNANYPCRKSTTASRFLIRICVMPKQNFNEKLTALLKTPVITIFST